jgi:hypothetical protein
MRAVLLALILAVPVIAQMEGNPENWCRDGFFTRDSQEFKIGKVLTARAAFHSDEKDECPEGAACRRKAYLVRGNEVLVNRVRGSFACAWYSPAKGSPTVGWLKISDLEISSPSKANGTRDWLGEWVDGENGIEFTDNKLAGFLNVTGNASWKGLGDNVHVGEIDGRYAPENGVIKYSDGEDEYDCKMTMRLVGRYLVVSDNLKCGGVNVTFSGVYTKRKK